jgi:glycosyltransferase involved in cell wall biosynthesis
MLESQARPSGASSGGPDVSIAVATRDRPLRLRWLLNALLEQTYPPERFEVWVAHDSASDEVGQMLDAHPLRAGGQLQVLSFPPRSRLAGAKRNAAWRASRAPLVLFTDDDCRPSPDWLTRAVQAARAQPRAILQGTTLPDPDESAILRGASWVHTVRIDPPTTWAETCNIAYPRALLEQLGGFEEHRQVGEDTDLAVRGQESGAALLAVPEMVVYHAVLERSLVAAVRAAQRWGDMAWLAQRHPAVRRDMTGRIFWSPEQAALVAALAGAGLARRRPAAWALGLPWLGLSLRHRGYTPRGLVRSVTELPGRAAIDLSALLALARASLRYRTVLL